MITLLKKRQKIGHGKNIVENGSKNLDRRF
jgi:hypothetical protein